MHTLLTNQIILIAVFILLIASLLIIYSIKRSSNTRAKKIASTALLKRQMMRQSSAAAAMQFDLRAKEYGIEDTLDEIKKNLNRITAQKNEITLLFEELQEKIIKENIKIEEVKVFSENIKSKIIELQAKTAHFCSEENINRFEAELPKISSAMRIMHAKDKEKMPQENLTTFMQAAEKDIKHYLIVMKAVRELPKEIKSFIAFVETQFKALEKKCLELFSKKHQPEQKIKTEHQISEAIKSLADTHNILKKSLHKDKKNHPEQPTNRSHKPR